MPYMIQDVRLRDFFPSVGKRRRKIAWRSIGAQGKTQVKFAMYCIQQPQPYSFLFLYNGPPLLRSLAAACSGVISLWGSANSSYLKCIKVNQLFFSFGKAKTLCRQAEQSSWDE